MTSIAISSGHGKYISGAVDIIHEHTEAVKVVDRVYEILIASGVPAKKFEDTTSRDQTTNLNTIVNWHNAQNRELDVSVHFNSNGHTSGPIGTECYYYSKQELASAVAASVASHGELINRGGKQNTGLFFLNSTNKPAILIEVCFVTSETDVEHYRENFDAICTAIAEVISGQSAVPPGPEVGLPPKFSQDVIDQICQIASSSKIADYSWKDRGQGPAGYINGMAIAYAQAVVRFNNHDPVMLEMAKADTYDDDIDALSWYRSNFNAIGMSNAAAGIDTLRHLYVLLLGLGMRESSGQHCCGRDQSASNTSSDTAEAGLFQTSWNAHSCSDQFDTLAGQYDKDSPQGYMSVFAEDVSCLSSDWASYGSGAGYAFQETCKWSPVYAVETCAITLRNLRQHYGPINRKEAEIRADADALFKQVQDYISSAPPPEDELQALIDDKPETDSPDAHVQWLTDSMDYILRHLR
jgi:N-acetylmuramoyl-L-alanine amidase